MLLQDLVFVLLSSDVQNYISRYGYFGIYIWFVTVDQIAPIPEEISLLALGYFASSGMINPVLAGIFSLLAFMTIDVIYYYLTKSGNKFIKRFTKKAHSKKMEIYKNRLRKNLAKTLFGLNFIPRLRLLIPVFVALSGLEFRRFIIYNTISLAIFISLYLAAGYVFSTSIGTLIKKTGRYEHVVFIGATLLLVGLSVFFYRKFRGKKTTPQH